VKPRWRHRLHWRGAGERLGAWWQLTYGVLYLPVAALCRMRYRNPYGLPATGPVIIAANHVSHADPLLLSKFVLDMGRVPRFLAKDSLFRGRLLGRALRGMGHIPVERHSIDAQQSLGPALAALRMGRVIMMYPEGTVTRDPDGWPMAARLGTARLALAAPDVAVIPIAQWGVQDSIDLYRKRVRLIPRSKHTILVGPPVDLSAFRLAEGELPSATNLLRMTDVIMTDLRSLVAELRGVPAPTGPFYRWRPSRQADSAKSASPQSASPQSASPQSASPQSASPQSASPQSGS
jgi:1-acyl-sn-glycerol-3-phosphate acyltransferase